MPKHSLHRGVGLILCDDEKKLFYLQQKDETYPIEKWRLALSVWGGAIEIDDTSEEAALLRELKEELDWNMNIAPLKIGSFEVQSDKVFPITLYELTLPKQELLAFAQSTQPNEGYGLLVPFDELWKSPWVWDLDKIIKPYLGG